MTTPLSRRDFVRGAALTSAAVAACASSQMMATEPIPGSAQPLPPMPPQKESLPMGKIGKHEFSRMMLGGNLMAGYAHARELRYVSHLMRRYNTEAKILETLELAEVHGINVVNTPVWDDNVFLAKHWKRGGKMKWIAQAKVGPNFELDTFQKAIDMGACGVHMQGHEAERMFDNERMDVVAKSVELVKSQGAIAGVGAHSLKVVQACEDMKVNADFYVKTLHSNKYPSAPRAKTEMDKWGLGQFDNCWCHNADEVVEYMEFVKKPWIAFKVLAAGAINPQIAFKYSFDNGADFILVGMFDWQVEENIQIARDAVVNCQRNRMWRS